MKRYLSWLPVLLCAVLAPHGGSPLPAHAEVADHDQPSEVLIDIGGSSNPFDLVMSRIVDRLIGKDTTLRRVVIAGDATVTEADFHTRLSGEYGAGWLICGSTTKSGNYPVAWGGGTDDGDEHIADFNGRLEIVFEHVHLTVRQTGSSMRLVPLKFGCNYEVGWKHSSAGQRAGAPIPGNRLEGIVVKGHLQIDFTGDADGDWVAGHIPSAKTTTPLPRLGDFVRRSIGRMP